MLQNSLYISPDSASPASVVVTLASCARTHGLHSSLRELGPVLQLAVTEAACTRLGHTGLLLPLVPPHQALPQLLADFK